MGFCDFEGAAPGRYSQQNERLKSRAIFIGVQTERKRAPFPGEAQPAAGAAFLQRFVGQRGQRAQGGPDLIGIDQVEDHGSLR